MTLTYIVGTIYTKNRLTNVCGVAPKGFFATKSEAPNPCRIVRNFVLHLIVGFALAPGMLDSYFFIKIDFEAITGKDYTKNSYAGID